MTSTSARARSKAAGSGASEGLWAGSSGAASDAGRAGAKGPTDEASTQEVVSGAQLPKGGEGGDVNESSSTADNIGGEHCSSRPGARADGPGDAWLRAPGGCCRAEPIASESAPMFGPDAYDYRLPPQQIAQRPSARRGDARLMVVRGEGVDHHHVPELPRLLPEDALLVVNASRVVPARLHAVRDDGRTFELLVCAPAPGQGPGTTIAAWVRGARTLRPGDRLRLGALELVYRQPDDIDPRARRFSVEAGDVLATCQGHGALPLPPYIEREAGPTDEDQERYQTVFARHVGSIAAPTAGLHLEPALLERLDVAEVTLHVGPGTFLPLESDDVRAHRVGSERIAVTAEHAAKIEAARRAGRPIVAVGTTVTRTLEALALGGRPIEPTQTTTDLVIVPGHRFEVVTHLLTNFHLPRSSLLMLVCTFAGREAVLHGYAEAVAAGYRFYSYGDCMLCARARDSGRAAVVSP